MCTSVVYLHHGQWFVADILQIGPNNQTSLVKLESDFLLIPGAWWCCADNNSATCLSDSDPCWRLHCLPQFTRVGFFQRTGIFDTPI
ncbi:hypothetical protein AD929_03590 [Gluconobacter potus]|uniref:Uncharacterized protein n=1 Tax=Gluconobacter potus TaxID=2724927 RepID=A0A149QY11_9PROT|nr:hypothetical protein AD929_03590 [Gluconobacter potus]